MKLFHILVIIWASFLSVRGFKDGGPAGACLSMYPVHDETKQRTNQSPFSIKLAQTSFSPSEEINVTLSAADGRPFIGIMLNVHRQAGDREQILGTFSNFPENKAKVFNYLGGKANCFTHKNSLPVREINLTWSAPAVEIGNVTFRATFLESFEIFWWDVTTDLPSDTPVQQTVANAITAASILLDYDSCGQTAGCLLYPTFCSGADCSIGIIYTSNEENVTIQVWANAESYVAVGFSDDRLMGHDETINCVHDGISVSFQHGYNPTYHNERQYTMNLLSDLVTSYIDGRLTCAFTRPHVMNVSHYGRPVTFDLNDPYYVMVAWGEVVSEGADVMAIHEELPITSQQMVDFRQYTIQRFQALPLLTQIHGILMLVAWILFGGVTTVISRYYRPIASGTKIFGKDVWFQVHRASAVLTAAITSASFVIIFVKVDGLSEVAELHCWFGVAVMAGVTLQIIGGVIRPGPKSSARPWFNWLHFVLGKSVHILAAISCFVMFNTGFLPKDQEWFGTLLTGVWVGSQVFWEIVLEICKCRMTTTATYSMKTEGKQETKTNSIPNVLLFFYIVTMAAMLVPASIAIFSF